ncbi:hypothetical protein [Lichenifustis flavocetrariae]|uniref:Uncharacterized protein n=1 Tax=Lichenifustis flavocetrariae TaxID=2949735 RepID=A0AA42CMB9_9HYPH|nr:hypothetical protein [Lichenifustis flavocetrariae]MCW6508195.1 hypothetical protein [Lichenifustis flavocetrariae]
MSGASDAPAAPSSTPLTSDGIEGALKAMCLVDVHAALAALQAAKTKEAILTGAEAALDLVALFFPPAIVLEDVLKLIGALIVLRDAGLVRSGQPEDPALARCAGR